MSGIDRITQSIVSEAQQKADDMIRGAKELSKLKTDQAMQEALAKKEEIIAKAKADAEEIIKRRISVAELEARKMRLFAKQEMVGEVFDETQKKLESMPKDEYMAFMENLILQSVNGGEEIVVNKRDKEEIGLKLIAKIDLIKLKSLSLKMPVLSADTADITGGFILRDGNTETNNSFRTIVESHREESIPKIVETLFE
ncbi:V-type proton ATPase subunit E [bioreactor metagenome]|uniref:V-type proton ATPase subunit E n=1 Tax=bioreactor metagenome TaxID=1076179 RepID=A0A645ADL8_9ZZZZ